MTEAKAGMFDSNNGPIGSTSSFLEENENSKKPAPKPSRASLFVDPAITFVKPAIYFI